MQNWKSFPITEKFRWHLYSKPTHCEYPEWHEGEGQHGAHEGHGDGHVDVAVLEQGPEVRSGASWAAAEDKQTQSGGQGMKYLDSLQADVTWTVCLLWSPSQWRTKIVAWIQTERWTQQMARLVSWTRTW